MKNIFLFTGDHSYQLEKQVQQWKDKFHEKHGEYNINEFDISDMSEYSELFSSIQSVPFLGDKRLVIIDSFPFSSKIKVTKPLEQFEQDFLLKVKEFPESTVVVLISPQPDKRRSKTKELLGQIEVKEFFKNDAKYEQDIRMQCLQVMDSRDISFFIERVGADIQRLFRELEKLKSYSDGKKLTREEIASLVVAGMEEEIFALTNAVASQDRKRALHILHQLVKQGEDMMALLGLIIWQVEQLCFVKDLLEEGKKEAEILRITGMKPFVYKKCLGLVRHFTKPQLLEAHRMLYHIDKHIKTGVVSYTKDHPEELLLALEHFIVAL